MKILSLIIKREYITRIKKKSFFVLTLLMPILFAITFYLPLLLSKIKEPKPKQIAIIDETRKYESIFISSDDYVFENISNMQKIKEPKTGEVFFAFLQITENLNLNSNTITLLSEKQIPKELINYIENTLSNANKKEKLEILSEENGVDSITINKIKQILNENNKISITTLRLDNNGGEKESNAVLSELIGVIFTFIMYIFILMYGAMVMNGVVEEKSNRIVEVMISIVRPIDLMLGKIIGIGLTGLTQLFIWIIIGTSAIVITNFTEGKDIFLNINQQFAILGSLPLLTWFEIIIYFVLFFIGGYLVYASIFAMFGASVDNVQDTQQFVMPITFVFIFTLYAGIYSINNPDGPLAFWCSMIPFTSPIVMMVRIPFGIPLWEKLLSLFILYLTIFFVVKFVARIYRVGILMYGKKPSIKEILKWISFK